mgnify:CR=1 FL=1
MAYLFSRMELATVRTTLEAANYLYLAPAAALFLGAMTSAAVKWYVLLHAQGVDIPFRAVLSYTYVGFFFNNFLPANVGGDMMRGYGLARYTERAAEAAVSVVVDRLVGLIAFMIAALVAAVVAAGVMQRAELQGIELAASLGSLILAGAFALSLSRRVRARIARLFARPPLARLSPLYDRLSHSLGAYRHRYGALALALVLSWFTLTLTNLTDYCIAQSLGGGLPLIYIFIFNPIIAFVLLVPVSIGGLGVTQAAYPFFYGLMDARLANLAFAMSLLKQLIIYVTSLSGGVLWWRGRAGAGEASRGRFKPNVSGDRSYAATAAPSTDSAEGKG